MAHDLVDRLKLGRVHHLHSQGGEPFRKIVCKLYQFQDRELRETKLQFEGFKCLYTLAISTRNCCKKEKADARFKEVQTTGKKA